MKVICVTALVTRQDLVQFHKELSENIDKIQSDGYQVEIQYSPTAECHSALIIGYKEKTNGKKKESIN